MQRHQATRGVNSSAFCRSPHPSLSRPSALSRPSCIAFTDFQSTHQMLLKVCIGKVVRITNTNRLLTEYVTVLPLGHLCWWCSSAGACCWTVQGVRVGNMCEASSAGDPLGSCGKNMLQILKLLRAEHRHVGLKPLGPWGPGILKALL